MLAGQKLARENSGQTLQATALVHEAWLRLGGDQQPQWQNRAQFFSAAAEAMRRILVDFARTRRYQKRGGGEPVVALDEAGLMLDNKSPDLVALDEALTSLTELDVRQSKVVELRFFGGLSVDETAEVLKISNATVRRDWRLGRAWLHRELATAA